MLQRVYTKHFEELQYLWAQRQMVLHSPDHTAADAARLGEQIEAHLDGLVLGGEEAVPVLAEWLEGDDPSEVFAAAYVLLTMQTAKAAQLVVEAYLEAGPPKLDGFLAAFCEGPVGLVLQELLAAAVQKGLATAAVALESLAFHGVHAPEPDRLPQILADEEPWVRRIGWQTVTLREPASAAS